MSRVSDETLRQRMRLRYFVLETVRDFFRSRGFTETDTPLARRFECSDPHIDCVTVTFSDPRGYQHAKYLHTSPEYSMKRLLALGFDRIFQLSPVFRDCEQSRLHAQEFLMLEWYRTGCTYDKTMDDVCSLVNHVCHAVDESDVRGAARFRMPPAEQWKRTKFSTAVLEHAGIDVDRCKDRKTLARALRARGSGHVAQGQTWTDMVYHLLVEQVEPNLGARVPEFLMDYPAEMASLAKIRRQGSSSCAERFELYVEGIEVANGFTEETDPVEHKRRFEQDNLQYCARTGHSRHWDRDFLKTLRDGLPESSGVAVGIDRLIMILAGAHTVQSIRPPL